MGRKSAVKEESEPTSIKKPRTSKVNECHRSNRQDTEHEDISDHLIVCKKIIDGITKLKDQGLVFSFQN